MRRRHRQRAQITPFALFAMLVLTGAVALVVDAGIFFVTQRQLQTAVDAAALAAVWYSPVCDYLNDGPPSDCRTSAPPLPPPLWACDPAKPADCVANAVVQENVGFSGALCRSLEPVPTGRNDIAPPLPDPNAMNYYIMTVDCEAPYWFARIFPSIQATMCIRAFARATIGYPTLTGVSRTDSSGTGHLVSRLFT